MSVREVKARIDAYQQRHPWLGFPYAVGKRFGEDRAGQQAALIAFYGFFALFPLLLVFVTVLAMVLRSNPQLQDDILRSTLSQFPIIGDQLRENVGAISRSSGALVIGIVGALWAGLVGVKTIQNAMDHVWGVPLRERPGLVKLVVRGLVMLLVLGAFALVATGLAGASVGGESAPLWLRLFSPPLSLAVNIGIFLLAFKVLTAAEVSWGDVARGAVLAGIAWTGLQTIGGYLVSNRLRDATALYGFFGVVIGLLSWMYLTALMTLFCVEVNVVRKKRLWPRSLTGSPESETRRTRALPGGP